MIKVKKDSKGHLYVDIGEATRLTIEPGAERAAAKNWAGCTVLRVQTYRNDESSSMHMGPEIPIPDAQAVMDLAVGLFELYKAFFHPEGRN